MYDTVAVESVRLTQGRGRGVARYRTPAVYGPPPPSAEVTIPWSAGHRTNVVTRTSTRQFSTTPTKIESWNANVRGNFFIARFGRLVQPD